MIRPPTIIRYHDDDLPIASRLRIRADGRVFAFDSGGVYELSRGHTADVLLAWRRVAASRPDATLTHTRQ